MKSFFVLAVLAALSGYWIVVLVPLLVPLGAAFGMNLFLTAYRFGKPLPEVFRAAFPAFCVLATALVAVTLLPSLATALPELTK